MTFFLIGGKTALAPTVRYVESLNAAAEMLKLDKAEIAHAIEEHGRLDTERHTLIPCDP